MTKDEEREQRLRAAGHTGDLRGELIEAGKEDAARGHQVSDPKLTLEDVARIGAAVPMLARALGDDEVREALRAHAGSDGAVRLDDGDEPMSTDTVKSLEEALACEHQNLVEHVENDIGHLK